MKIRKILYIAGLCTALVVGAVFGGGMLGLAAEPGGAADPLVTRSYVHQLLNNALAGQTQAQASEPHIFTPVQVFAGHVIMGHEGTEMILRSGLAVANVPAENGIIDVTDGIDIMHGDPIGLNNFLIIPREDGRGIFAISDIWVMVKGDFNIVFVN
ncbi:MAG: hypothetical protein FWB74_08625 [Defluviitaleaceae bacterium]|nr:hypothetical protein [Defluviitaleaceae bacterium]